LSKPKLGAERALTTTTAMRRTPPTPTAARSSGLTISSCNACTTP
jgi:hypothetical protein